jgi:hypothetical protein
MHSTLLNAPRCTPSPDRFAAQSTTVSVVLWRSTSKKAQILRRFSESYPQAVAVVKRAQKSPSATPTGGGARFAEGLNGAGPVLPSRYLVSIDISIDEWTAV